MQVAARQDEEVIVQKALRTCSDVCIKAQQLSWNTIVSIPIWHSSYDASMLVRVLAYHAPSKEKGAWVKDWDA